MGAAAGIRVYHVINAVIKAVIDTKTMTSLLIIPTVLEVSCAMQDLSRGQKGRLAKGWVCGLVDFGASR